MDKIDQTPGLRDKLDDDLQVAEFLSSLDKIAKLDCSEDDVRPLGISERIDAGSGGGGSITTVDSNAAEILAEARLKEISLGFW